MTRTASVCVHVCSRLAIHKSCGVRSTCPGSFAPIRALVEWIVEVKGRSFLAYAIAVSLVEQAVLLLVAFWILPKAGIEVPAWLVVVVAILLAIQSVILTRVNLRTLDRKPLFSPDSGAHGRAVSDLNPAGYVRIDNELWRAVSDGEDVEKGQMVVVKSRDGMRLIVSGSVSQDNS